MVCIVRQVTELLGIWVKQQIKRLLGERRKKQLLFGRARMCEQIGIQRYSWPGWNGLDRRLVAHLGRARDGIFIEAGANDGYAQSNTYHLERFLGWTGLLIEPVPELADLCRRFRPSADVREVALCAPADEGRVLTLSVQDLKTSVARASVCGDRASRISVPCRTLASIVRDAALPRIDLLSLDVEGYELAVLAGVDDTMPRPRHILVETSRRDDVAQLLGSTHRWAAQLSHHDHLFAAV